MNVSVGITSYNQRDLLIEAVESVLAQSVMPFEVWIVDDASADDSPDVIRGYAARYPELIRPILLDRNSGPNAARNQVIAVATGDYLTFLDGDDRWLPAKLERECARLAEPDQPDAVFSNFYFTDKEGRRSFLWTTDRRPPEGHLLRHVLTLDLPRATLFRSEVAPTTLWRAAGYFDTSFAIYGDWDMRVRLAAAVPRFAYVDEPLCEYRRHGAGLSNNGIEMHLAAVDHIERKYAGLIDEFPTLHDDSLRRGLDRFRAKLLRRAALDALARRSERSRSTALGYYRRSLGYDFVIDPRFIWYLIKP